MSYTVGNYLADRLVQIGLKEHFAIAGDYNLVLLDQLLENTNLKQIYDCNELNCGFAAEGYARANGAACCVVTFSVGMISAMNSAMGGAYAENFPVLCVSGSPNSNDYGSGHVLHHTIGGSEYHYQMEMVRHLTCAAESITQAADAPAKIDHVIRTMLLKQKPAYLDIACNVADAECARPGPVESILPRIHTDETSLKAAVTKILSRIENSKNVVVYIGPGVRPAKAQKDAIALADRLGCAVVNGGAAMALFPGEHPQYRGTYWGDVSTGEADRLVKEADTLIVLGPNWNDYSTVGWAAWPKGDHVITLDMDSVSAEKEVFSGIPMNMVLKALSAGVPARPASAEKSRAPKFDYPVADPAKPLDNTEMARQIQGLLTSNTTIFAETGDSWFNVEQMNWPNGLRIESEMQWGHIGWSIPSGFGNAVGSPDRQHIIMCGDGSFQLTAQEVGQMVRYKLPVMIFLIDNKGYGIEIAIHDGPYNYIQNWNYSRIMDVFNGTPGNGGLGLKATTGGELAEAIRQAQANREGPTLIQCCIPSNSFTDKLAVWGHQVARNNSRPPVIK